MSSPITPTTTTTTTSPSTITTLTIFDLPQELIEKIIDSIPPSDSLRIPTLQSLTTVSQSFRLLAHRRLFRSVVVNTQVTSTCAHTAPSSEEERRRSEDGNEASSESREESLRRSQRGTGTGTGTKTRRQGTSSLALKLLDALIDASYLAVYTTELDVTLDDNEEDSYRPWSPRQNDNKSQTEHDNKNENDDHLQQQRTRAQTLIPRILPYYCGDAHKNNSNLRKFALRQSEFAKYYDDDTGRYSQDLPKPIVQAVVRVLGLGSLVHVELKNVPIVIVRCLSPSVRRLALWNPRGLDLEREGAMGKRIEGLLPDSAPENVDMGGGAVSGPREPRKSRLNAGGRLTLSLESLLIDDAKITERSENRNASALKWLLDQQDKLDFTKLKRLRIGVLHCGWMEGHEQVANLLRLCGDTLEEFSFSPSFDALATENPETEPITLAILPSLKYLHIGAQTGFWKDGTNIYDPIPWLCAHLLRASSPSMLKTIAFSSSYGMMFTQPSFSSSSSIAISILMRFHTSNPHFESLSPSSPLIQRFVPLLNYFGCHFQSYTSLDMLLSGAGSGAQSIRFPHLKKIDFHIEEAPYFKDYMQPPHTFNVRAAWIEHKIREGMRALVGPVPDPNVKHNDYESEGKGAPCARADSNARGGVEVEISSSGGELFSKRLMLDADW